GEALLTPTRIYAKPVRQLLTKYPGQSAVHGIAHITGGGLHENLERIVPEGSRVMIDRGSWKVPAVFTWLQKLGDVAADEMSHVFNMGIGLVLVVDPQQAEPIRAQLSESGYENWQIGRVVSGTQGVVWSDQA